MKRRPESIRGFSLPELMVAVAIGLVLTLTISLMVSKQESLRRGVTSGNDLTSNVAYVSYLLDQELRSAGAGFSQRVASHYGCQLFVSRSNSQLLPAPAAFPAPFAAIPQNPVLAPLIVFAGAGTNGSDVIAVATGNGALGETALTTSPGSATAGQITLSNTLGLRGGDLVLVSQPVAPVNCMLQQVSTGFTSGAAQVLTFGGTYAANTIGIVTLVGFVMGNLIIVTALGNVVGNQPRLQLIGIGANNVLSAYDLLQLTPGVQALAEGVVDLRVRYGVAALPINPDPTLRTVANWVAPTAAGYTAAALSNGSAAARDNLQSILAVRIGLVLRSDQAEKAAITTPTLTLFGDLPATLRHSYTVPATTTTQRYRTVEFTIPLRNVRLSR
jgi:type IV pilus assembly protein PilW